MAKFLLFLAFTTLAITHDFDVTRDDAGDYFVWYANHIVCTNFSSGTAYPGPDSGSRCRCSADLTFSTETSACETFKDQVYYRFDRSGLSETFVSTVHAECGADNFCTLNSTVAKFNYAELAVTKLNNQPLNSNSNCTVNFVEVINNCKPRLIKLELSFISRADNKLYLQLHRTADTSLSDLKGELFQVDITCANDGGNKKLMFKYSGTSRLTDRGYDPSKRCSDVTTSSASAHTTSPTSTGKPSHSHGSQNAGIAIAISIATLIAIILVIIVLVIRVRFMRKTPANYQQITYTVGSGSFNRERT